jgi:Transposase IS4
MPPIERADVKESDVVPLQTLTCFFMKKPVAEVRASQNFAQRRTFFSTFSTLKIMPPRSKTMGKGATVSILSKYLHPSEHIRNKWSNPLHGHRLENLTVVRREDKTISRTTQQAVVVTHPEFKDGNNNLIELHANKRWFRVDREGPVDLFFDKDEAAVEKEQAQTEEELQQPMPAVATRGARLDATDLSELQGVVDIDDDNEPLPENIPTAADGVNEDMFNEWGHTGMCWRKQEGNINNSARLPNWSSSNGVPPTIEKLFEILFPILWLKTVLLVETNKHLEEPVSYGEFLQWIGIWFLMATTHFDNRRDFWSIQNVDYYFGAPYRLHDLMSRNRFENILRALRFTNVQPPAFRDRFWEVRQMLDAWNSNMTAEFIASWISCLDESMSKWVSEFTCPGFMCVPRKPWPFGNEYHSICCALSGIMYFIELVEGKDEPRERPKKAYSELGKTVGMLQRLTQPIWHTGKVVVLDSGFCVLQALIELRKRGVFGAALIKKRRYWPKFIRGDEIAAHFVNKEVGDIDSWPGTMDNVKFHIVCMKEPDYIMSLMSTYGTMERVGDTKSRNFAVDGHKKSKTFKYPEVVRNHFLYRDAVDAHNSSRMDPISLEETWKTQRWACRVFQFLLAITEVNCRLALEKLFNGDKNSQQGFRKMFAKALIFNSYIVDVSLGSPRSLRHSPLMRNIHQFCTIPNGKKFSPNGRLVPTKTKYLQRYCQCRNRRCRTYCSCSPGTILCPRCFATHVAEGQLIPRRIT